MSNRLTNTILILCLFLPTVLRADQAPDPFLKLLDRNRRLEQERTNRLIEQERALGRAREAEVKIMRLKEEALQGARDAIATRLKPYITLAERDANLELTQRDPVPSFVVSFSRIPTVLPTAPTEGGVTPTATPVTTGLDTIQTLEGMDAHLRRLTTVTTNIERTAQDFSNLLPSIVTVGADQTDPRRLVETPTVGERRTFAQFGLPIPNFTEVQASNIPGNRENFLTQTFNVLRGAVDKTQGPISTEGRTTLGGQVPNLRNLVLREDVRSAGTTAGVTPGGGGEIHSASGGSGSNTSGLVSPPPIFDKPTLKESTDRLIAVSQKTRKVAEEALGDVAKIKTNLDNQIKQAERDAAQGGGGLSGGASGSPLADAGQSAGGESAGGGGASAGGGGKGDGKGDGATVPSPTNTAGVTPGTLPNPDGNFNSFFPSRGGGKGKDSNFDFSPSKLNGGGFNPMSRYAYTNGAGLPGAGVANVGEFLTGAGKAGSPIGGFSSGGAADGGGGAGGAAPGLGAASSKGEQNLSAGVFDNLDPKYEASDGLANAVKDAGWGSESGADGIVDGGPSMAKAPKGTDGVGIPLALQLLPTPPLDGKDPNAPKNILHYMGYLKRDPCQDARRDGIGLCGRVKQKKVETAAKEKPALKMVASSGGRPVYSSKREPASVPTPVTRAAAKGPAK